MTRLTTTSLLAFTLAAACGGGGDEAPRGTARFAGATEANRDLAIQTAMGLPAVMAFLSYMGAEFDSLDQIGCPVRTEADGVVTLTADNCTGPDGGVYDGRIVARNAPSWADVFGEPSYDAAKPMEIELQQWSKDGVVIDGRLWQSSPEPQGAYSSELELTITGTGTMEIAMESSCAQESCTNEGFATLEGIGSFGIHAELVSAGDNEIGGWVELLGADTLRVDFDATADDCAPYTIDGDDAGAYCWEDTGEPEPEGPHATGMGWGCTDSNLDFTAWVSGDASSVLIAVYDPATQGIEELPMSYSRYIEEWDEHEYAALIPDASTALSCDAIDTYSYAITVVADDGSSQCTSFGENPSVFADCDPFF